MHSYTFPYKEERVLDLVAGRVGGREEGVAVYENLGFPVSKPGVLQSQDSVPLCSSLPSAHAHSAGH